MAGQGSEATYRPEIDGLRTVAVIPVVLFHMGFGWMKGGWAGVDVFFVISGFLITSILKRELDAGTFTFRGFWARRIRRIAPAMIVVTVATLAITYLFGFRPDRPPIGRQGAAALLSVANLYFWRTAGDYWGSEAENSPFLHFWSLAVEEQFYLFHPLALWAIFKIRRDWLPGLLAAVFCASLGLFLWGINRHPNATFYLLPTRAWELAAGGLLALAMQGRRPVGLPSEEAIACVGLAMIALSYRVLATLGDGVLLAVLGACLVLAFGRSGPCYRLLASPPVVHVGKLSYSLYLWHWPVLILGSRFGIERENPFLLVPMYLLALASYLLVERPTRHHRAAIPVSLIGYAGALGLAAAVSFGADRYDTSAFEKPHTYMFYYNVSPKNEGSLVSRQIAAGINAPRRTDPSAYKQGGFRVGPPGTPRIVLLGDSHGIMWSERVREVAERLQVPTALISMNGVRPFVQLPIARDQGAYSLTSEQKYEYDISRLNLIAEWKPDVVIVCVRWAAEDVTREAASDLMSYLARHAGRTILVEQPPQLLPDGRPNVLQDLCYLGMYPVKGTRQYRPMDVEASGRGRKNAQDFSSSFGCELIETFDLFAKGEEVLVLDGAEVLYCDYHHISDEGSRLAADRFMKAISAAINADSSADTGGASRVGTPR